MPFVPESFEEGHQLPEEQEGAQDKVQQHSLLQQMKKPIRALVLGLLATTTISTSTGCTPTLNLQGVSAENLPVGTEGSLPTPEQVREHPISQFLDTFSEADWKEIDIHGGEEQQKLRTALRYSMMVIGGVPKLTYGTLLLKDEWKVCVEVDGDAYYPEKSKREDVHIALLNLSHGMGVPLKYSDRSQADLVVSLHKSTGTERLETVSGYAPARGKDKGLSDVYFFEPDADRTVHVLTDRLLSPTLFPEKFQHLCASEGCSSLKEDVFQLNLWQTTIHEATHLLTFGNAHLPSDLNLNDGPSYMNKGLSMTITNHPEKHTEPYKTLTSDGDQHVFVSHVYAPKRDMAFSLGRLGRKYMKEKHPGFRAD